MKITLTGENELHLPRFCDSMGYFVGVTNVTLVQGADFDPTEGVYATDGYCGRIPYDVSPSEIDTCEAGTQTLVYSTVEFSKKRKITIVQADAPTITVPQGTNVIGVGETLNTLLGVSAKDTHGRTVAVTCLEGASVTYNTAGTYTLHYSAEDGCGNIGTAERSISVVGGSFSGVGDVSINQGNSFDPRSGVHAYDYQGNEIPFTVSPTTFSPCLVGVQTFNYTANGVEPVTRTVTVNPIANPTISGVPSTPLTVEVGETFDPLSGVSAVDGNGNAVAVTVSLEKPNLFEWVGKAQGPTPYYVVVQSALSYQTTQKSYIVTTDLPHCVPYNAYLTMLGTEYEISSDAPLQLTVPANTQVAVLAPYIVQTATEGTPVNASAGLDNSTYWIRIEEAD